MVPVLVYVNDSQYTISRPLRNFEHSFHIFLVSSLNCSRREGISTVMSNLSKPNKTQTNSSSTELAETYQTLARSLETAPGFEQRKRIYTFWREWCIAGRRGRPLVAVHTFPRHILHF
jgi:hypothetical protein